MQSLRHFVRTDGMHYLDDPNVSSVGIGHKNGDGPLCVQFTVNRKGGASEIEALGSSVIPETLEIGGELVATDVIERSFKAAYEILAFEEATSRKRRIDPIVPGVSVGHPSVSAGTFGALVFDRQSGAPCILSNWHVLHGHDGDIGDDVVQPGPHDDNRVEQNKAGTLMRSHLGAAGDCAIARIESRGFEPGILDLGVEIRRLARPELGDRIVKSGRTTGVTFGVVRRVDVVAKIDYEGVGEQKIGGFEIGPDAGTGAQGGEISMGGDSGSSWLVADGENATEIMVGLHFAGEATGNPDEHALACYAHSVFEKLDLELAPPRIEAGDGMAEAAMRQRRGYDPGFMSRPAPMPQPSTSLHNDVFTFNGSATIPYEHFSVCLSRSRRLARFVSWNVDGSSIRRLSRNGINFRRDPRLPREAQLDNSLYVDNPLDRGHLARRADLCWGASAEAKRANRDSFYWTNIAPQHARFNQSSRAGLWGELENAVFEDADVEDLRVSVMGGPILHDDDPLHRNERIPREFWKIVAWVESGNLKAKAYVLTQTDLVHDLEAFDLDDFRLFQVRLQDLGEMTGLNFSLDVDDVVSPERLEGLEAAHDIREITRRADLLG